MIFKTENRKRMMNTQLSIVLSFHESAAAFKWADNALFLKLGGRHMGAHLFFWIYDMVHYKHFIRQLRKHVFEEWY